MKLSLKTFATIFGAFGLATVRSGDTRSSVRRMFGALLGCLVTLSIWGGSSWAQTPARPVSVPARPVTPTREVWRAAMLRTPLTKQGCFTASYPAVEWKETACTPAPDRGQIPVPPPKRYVRKQGNTEQVGNGNDISAEVSGHIASAIGSFPKITDVTSITSSNTGSIADSFSLQLNSNYYRTAMCNSSPLHSSSCSGWTQFLLVNSINGGNVYMEDWLIGYGRPCPATWKNAPTGFSDDCYFDTRSTPINGQTAANLEGMSLKGTATLNGMDTAVIIAANGDPLGAMSYPDSLLNLSQGWKIAEFNIFGYGNGVEATINGGASIIVAVQVDDGTTDEPTAVNEGFTGETNNLTLVFPACRYGGLTSSIIFKESDRVPSSFICPKANDPCPGLASLITFDQEQLANDRSRLATSFCRGQALLLCTNKIKADSVALAAAEAERQKACPAK